MYCLDLMYSLLDLYERKILRWERYLELLLFVEGWNPKMYCLNLMYWLLDLVERKILRWERYLELLLFVEGWNPKMYQMELGVVRILKERFLLVAVE